MARSAWRGIQYAVYVTGVLHCDWLVSCVVCDGCVPHCDARVLHLSALLSTLFGSVSISLFVKPAHPRLRRGGAEVAGIILQWPRGPRSPKG